MARTLAMLCGPAVALLVFSPAHAAIQPASLLVNQPLRFEANRGQAPADILYLAQGANYRLAIRNMDYELSWTDPHSHRSAALVTGCSAHTAKLAWRHWDRSRVEQITSSVNIPEIGTRGYQLSPRYG